VLLRTRTPEGHNATQLVGAQGFDSLVGILAPL
jgi:hypothetical protein